MKKVALKLSVTYIVVGVLWIIVSDYITKYLTTTHSELFTAELFKGIVFVLFTACILYWTFLKHMFKAQEQLQYGKLFEDNPNPMWIYDLQNLQMLSVNKAALANYQYTREDFLSLSLHDIRPETEHAKLAHNLLLSSSSEEYTNSGIWLHKRSSGETFYVHVYSHNVTYKNREARLVLALDVHDRYLAAQRIKAQNEKLKDIAYFHSHKMRSPVATIMGLVSLFDLDDTDTTLNKDIMHKIDAVCKNLDSMIHEVVDKAHEIEANEPG